MGHRAALILELRFYDRIVPEPNSGCHLWLGAIHSEKAPLQYGCVRDPRRTQKRMLKAHRLAWELARGPIPNGLHVLHSCDTPLCVNVDHLFLGTNTDNVADRVRKGRTRVRPWVDRKMGRVRWATRPDACMAGHPWTRASTYVAPNGRRTCRICKHRRQREYAERKAAH